MKHNTVFSLQRIEFSAKQIRIVISALLVATLATSLPGRAVAQQAVSALSEKTSNANEILDRAQQSGNVRVIVEFDAPLIESLGGPAAGKLDEVMANVRSIQDTIIARHFGSADSPAPGQGFNRGLVRFSVTPAFVINVNAQELQSLAEDPLVLHIQIDVPVPPTLIESVPLIGMDDAYTLGATGAGEVVAILDTGIQANHEFLSSHVLAEACFSNAGGGGGEVSLCPNGSSSQTGTGAADATTSSCVDGGSQLCYHGTHVAGIAAGLNTNKQSGEPPYGVAKGAKIWAIQVFTRFNNSSYCGGGTCVLSFTSDQMLALDYLYANRATLPSGNHLASINMSLGGGYYTSTCDSDSRKISIDNLRSAGVATAIASGNNGYVDGVSAPGCISSATTVGSTTKSDSLSSFSNMSSVVDVLAPGSSILSSIPTVSGSIDTYSYLSGTSMATPHVAGAIAAIRSICPDSTVTEIEDALKATGTSVTDTRFGGTQSKPRINVDSALQQLGCSNTVSDFNQDGRSDILLRHSNGYVGAWLMQAGGQSKIWAGLGGPDASAGWSIVGIGDFNGDGRADILWRSSAGVTGYWKMAADGQSKMWVSLGSVPMSWLIKGTGDFNGDGRFDILWRNNLGLTGFWSMQADGVSKIWVPLGSPASTWSIRGTGDFNGDGRYDILWRESGGTVGYWAVQADGLSKVWIPLGKPASNWSLKGTGDFNGDGRFDILWRNLSGTTGYWLMAADGQSKTWVALGSLGTSWSVADTGDYDGDTRFDIVWRNTSGAVGVWLIQAGGQTKTSAVLGNPSTDWSIVNP